MSEIHGLDRVDTVHHSIARRAESRGKSTWPENRRLLPGRATDTPRTARPTVGRGAAPGARGRRARLLRDELTRAT